MDRQSPTELSWGCRSANLQNDFQGLLFLVCQGTSLFLTECANMGLAGTLSPLPSSLRDKEHWSEDDTCNL